MLGIVPRAKYFLAERFFCLGVDEDDVEEHIQSIKADQNADFYIEYNENRSQRLNRHGVNRLARRGSNIFP